MPRIDMKFSVIIPILNAAGTVGSTLDALVEQSWPSDWEVLIADNGSTDSLGAIVRPYKTKIPSLKVIDASAKRGPAYARNMAVGASTGDRILFCDADDVPGRGWSTAMAFALAKHDFVAARFEFEELNPPSLAAIRRGTQTGGLQTCQFLPFHYAGSGGIGIYRRLHDAVGGFDETILIQEDTDYCMRVQLAGHKLVFVPDAVVHIRLRATESGMVIQAYSYAKHVGYLYKKYGKRSSWELWRWRAYLHSWRILLQRTPALARTPEGRNILSWRVGTYLGALRGSLRWLVPPVMIE
jgi:glycosyltransferase involved in cell wall biosynthesis